MCGITGYFSAKKLRPASFAKANNLIRHRGPDDYGYLMLDHNFSVSEPVAEDLSDAGQASEGELIGMLGFRRLSIIDLSSNGHQPMSYRRKRCWIVFNGEIYNYLELRQELSAKGHQFQSDTDTEVLLAAYTEWGVECLQKLNGMWAFAILDLDKRQLFCSRDRLGIKPFYYHLSEGVFCFASEAKQLLDLFPKLRKANRSVLFDYLAIGTYGNETDDTFFEGIQKLRAGSYMLFDLQDGPKLKTNLKYWELPIQMEAPKREAEAHGRIQELLAESIGLRLRSDVPLGICLSGGLDSSGISMLAAQQRNGTPDPLRLFTIGSLDSSMDETHYARLISEQANFEHYTKVPDSKDLSDELSTFIWHHDEPLIKASMFGGYHVYKLAKESGATVVLDGQGADEMMGGYNFGVYYPYLVELLSSLSLGQFFKEWHANARLHNASNLKVGKGIAATALKQMLRPVFPQQYQPALKQKTQVWLKRDFIRESIPASIRINKSYLAGEENSYSSGFKQDSFELLRFTNLPGILRQVDRNSMAFSVEARVPFLDHRLVEYLFSLPASYHLRGGYTKYAYRKAMEGVIPEQILWRTDKKGFAMPDRLLLKGASEYIADIIAQIPAGSPLYDKPSIEKIYRQELESDDCYRPIYWRVVNALVWQDTFGITL